MTNVQIITPYVHDHEIQQHKQIFWEYDIHYEKDEAGIGSDLMFQQIWKKYPDKDIFILHADMYQYEDGWLDKVISYVSKYPEAGIFGCLLLYPVIAKEQKHYIQCAGGRFVNNVPDHFGSGISVENMTAFKNTLEVDEGQYNYVREVAWTTFGGCYIRRDLITAVGDFSPEYEWTYNRDVDYCLSAREKGFKIYQIPVKLLHHESRDNKRIRAANPEKAMSESRNLETLLKKWGNTKFYKTVDKVVEKR